MPDEPQHRAPAPVPAVFFDRDGVLIEEVGHLRELARLRLLPGAAQAVRELAAAGFRIVIVTNQSAVARGLLSEAGLREIHEHLLALLRAEGAEVDDLRYCPHHPTEGVPPWNVDCLCRKPAPGMLLEAAATHRLDLSRSYLIGDKRSDIAAARRAGCGAILVLTGHGSEEARTPAMAETTPDAVFAGVLQAARYILSAREDVQGLPTQRLTGSGSQ